MIRNLIFCIFLLLIGCTQEESGLKENDNNGKKSGAGTYPEVQNLNVSILIDLSDRISPEKYPNETMQYYQRDVEYIKSVVQGFQSVVMNKKVRTINDNINVYFDPPPKSKEVVDHADKLKAEFTRHNITKEKINDLDDEFAKHSLALYQQAIEDGDYIGSDTWGFFKNNVENYCIRDDYRNILVILTDGYIYHKDQKREQGNRASFVIPERIRKLKLNDANWKERMAELDIGFISIEKDLSNLEILVLGINPDDKNEYEEDVLLHYWMQWFDEMNVMKYELMLNDLPTNLDRNIRQFISAP
jgi:hypothetical protein